MTTTFVDVRWSAGSGTVDAGDAGWVRYVAPRDYPSPAMLAAAGARVALGEEVAYRYIDPGELAQLEGGIVAAPPTQRRRVESVRGATMFDPFDSPGGEGAARGYDLVRGRAECLAEIDVIPPNDPVHPWVFAPSGRSLDDAELVAAVASLATGGERDLYLNDPRIPLSMDRLRSLARLVTRAAREHATALRLHLRAWPRDLDRRIVDHLTLLPVGSLDVLAGKLDGIEETLAVLRDGGMSHLSGISLVLGMPGQSAQDCVEIVKAAIAAATSARVRRVRFAYWLGEGVRCPATPAGYHELFAAAHPDWHPIEYAGVGDFIALMRGAVRNVEIAGPELAPGWEAPPVEADAIV